MITVFANSSFEFAHNFDLFFLFFSRFSRPWTSFNHLIWTSSKKCILFYIYIYMYILDENTKLKTGLSFRRSPKTLILLLVDSCFRDFVLGLLYGNKFQPRDQPLARGIKNFTWKYRDFNSVVPRR